MEYQLERLLTAIAESKAHPQILAHSLYPGAMPYLQCCQLVSFVRHYEQGLLS